MPISWKTEDKAVVKVASFCSLIPKLTHEAIRML